MPDARLSAWARYTTIPPRINIARECIDKPIAAGAGPKIAIVSDSATMTYDELDARVSAFAASLTGQGIARGDRVLIRMWNCPEFVIAFLAITKIGAVAVTQNTATGVADVDYVLGHGDCVAAIALDEQAGPLRELRAKLPKGLIVARGAKPGEGEFEAMSHAATPLRGAGRIAHETVDTTADEPAFMCYTSGTTGKPKGILHAHRWLVARGDANRDRVPPLPNDVVMAAGEWSFISLLGHNVLFALRNGVTCAAMEGRPTPERFLECIEKFKVTVGHAVPTIYRRLLAMDGIEKRYDTSSLRGCNASGEALGAATLADWRRRYGVDIWEHYGISEMQLAISHGPLIPLKAGSIGIPWGTDARILDEDHNELPTGEVGQLCIRADNPSFFLGYHKDKAKTDEVIHHDWFHTGDLARRDEDGYFWIAGRNDDCFKSRGIFIVPIEIENALVEHDKVAEACIVPVPHAQDGNLIRAVVALKAGLKADPGLVDELKELLRGKIARNKIPHSFEFVDALPKSAIGKVLRRDVMALSR
jgi:acyl-coenzyme A synthetase/AMP-(fatty) acid ligase